MKLYAVKNCNSKSDYDLNDDDFESTGSSNAHSGGAVLVAENIEEANRMMNEMGLTGTLVEIVPNKKGFIIIADADC